MPTPSPYQWNARAARYRDPNTGRFISRDAVRVEVDRIVSASQRRVTAATEQLASGAIDLAQWDATMRQEIKRAHLGSSALLNGGWKQLTPADYGRVGAAVRAQYKYLEGFLDDIRAGRVRGGTLLNRAKMYPASARIVFHEQQTTQLDDLGYTEERNVLHPAEHCDVCIDASARGWVPIGTNIPIGKRTCLGNDKCSMRYR
jgi:hypothetical protein